MKEFQNTKVNQAIENPQSLTLINNHLHENSQELRQRLQAEDSDIHELNDEENLLNGEIVKEMIKNKRLLDYALK